MLDIAFVGEMHSGKTTALQIAQSLVEQAAKNWFHIRIAAPLYAAQNLFVDGKHRVFLQELSDLAKKHFGRHILSDIFTKTYNVNYNFVCLCDDIRTEEDFETVRKLGFLTVGIKASAKIRKERNPGQFINTEHITESQVAGLLNKVDTVVTNEGTEKEFKKQITAICDLYFGIFEFDADIK